jgi:uncharacterized integral membrane protein (TIGR00697 family)
MDRGSAGELTAVVIVTSAYVAAQIFSDVASVRIVSVAGWSVDAGTLVYPFTFTLRDLVHKLAGIHVARRLIVLAAGLNLVMAAVFQLAARLPGDPEGGPATALFGDVLAPVWRIVMASVVAEVVAELLDSEAYRAWVARLGSRRQWGRVLVSNAVSVPTDSAVFVFLAFAGDLPAALVWELFWVNMVVKLAVSLLSTPLIYLVRSPAQGTPPGPRPTTAVTS